MCFLAYNNIHAAGFGVDFNLKQPVFHALHILSIFFISIR